MYLSSRSTRRRSLLGVASLTLFVVACGDEEGGADVQASSRSALTQEHVIPTGQACAPTGKHLEHRAYGCATCHQCEGSVSFDGSVAGASAAFDATAKTCSNVACHGVPAGTFTYSKWDWGIEDMVTVSIPYGGGTPPVADWYAAPGMGCGVCHGYPPKYNGAAYAWHSGRHGSSTTANANACQLCHPDATGAYVYGGPPSRLATTGGLITSCAPGTYCSAPGVITNPSLHRNGVLDVAPRWASACNGCH
jgi:predicted CxxxxCH...CXXCH cytochrome family protein